MYYYFKTANERAAFLRKTCFVFHNYYCTFTEFKARLKDSYSVDYYWFTSSTRINDNIIFPQYSLFTSYMIWNMILWELNMIWYIYLQPEGKLQWFYLCIRHWRFLQFVSLFFFLSCLIPNIISCDIHRSGCIWWNIRSVILPSIFFSLDDEGFLISPTCRNISSLLREMVCNVLI